MSMIQERRKEKLEKQMEFERHMLHWIKGESGIPLSIWAAAAAAAAKSLQLWPTLCDPIDGSPPGSPVPGILQARTLEWAAISFSNAWKWKVKVMSLSRVQLLAIPWTAADQAPPSMEFPGKSTGVEFHCLLRSIWADWLLRAGLFGDGLGEWGENTLRQLDEVWN